MLERRRRASVDLSRNDHNVLLRGAAKVGARVQNLGPARRPRSQRRFFHCDHDDDGDAEPCFDG
eukprot:7098501-Pyramimonas_sp.AAC.1